MWKLFILGLSAGVLLLGCNVETSQITEVETETLEPELSVTEGPKFSQDGDIFNVKTGEEFSVLLDLPEGIKDSTVLWLPEQGGFGPHLNIVRSYRSVEGSLYYTEHQFRGGEPGQLVVTFAPKNGPKAVHGERRVITFNVE